jgi:hypothetical protein
MLAGVSLAPGLTVSGFIFDQMKLPLQRVPTATEWWRTLIGLWLQFSVVSVYHDPLFTVDPRGLRLTGYDRRSCLILSFDFGRSTELNELMIPGSMSAYTLLVHLPNWDALKRATSANGDDKSAFTGSGRLNFVRIRKVVKIINSCIEYRSIRTYHYIGLLPRPVRTWK